MSEGNTGGGDQVRGAQAEVRSRVSPKWVRRMVIIAAVLIAFGFWGLYDAAVAYPRRGEKASLYLEYQFLQQLDQRRELLDLRAAIKDPQGELERLRTRLKDGVANDAERACLTWLESLDLVGRLDAASATDIPRDDFRGERVESVRSRYDALTRQFTTAQGGSADIPSPLSRWDIPVQWLIMAGGYAIGGYILLLIVRVRGKTYAFDPATMRLTLPDGGAITPADLADVDKRRWHKFYCTLVVKGEHPTHAGRSIELDLMRYEPVEEWVLTMERAAFPDRAKDEPPPDAAAEPAPSDTPPGDTGGAEVGTDPKAAERA